MLVQSHDGAIHLLPALPNVGTWHYKRNSLSRRFSAGRDEMGKGKVQTVTIASTIGGTLRIRTASPLYLNGEKLTPATEESCNNPLLLSQPIRKPLVAASAPLSVPQKQQSYIYDIKTKAGERYTFLPTD